jgi:quercetin dioxygenase-like cupin family protein
LDLCIHFNNLFGMKIHINGINALELVPGFQARMIHSDRMTFSYVEVAAGATLPEHFHEHEQISHLLEGEFVLIVAGEPLEMSAGHTVVIPSNVPHSGAAITHCRIIDTFAPVREDYKMRAI